MDPEIKEALRALLQMTEENNKMLRKMRRLQKWESVWRTIKFLIIIGIAFGSFYFLEPYFDKVMQIYQSVVDMEKKISDSPIKSFFGQ